VPTTACSATATADACDKENAAVDTSVSSEHNNSVSSSSAVKANKIGDHNATAAAASSSSSGCNTLFSGGLSIGSINSKLVSYLTSCIDTLLSGIDTVVHVAAPAPHNDRYCQLLR
jgi:hypothetical protein